MCLRYYSAVVGAGNRAVVALRTLSGSKKIYKHVIREFMQRVGMPGKLPDLFDSVLNKRTGLHIELI